MMMNDDDDDDDDGDDDDDDDDVDDDDDDDDDDVDDDDDDIDDDDGNVDFHLRLMTAFLLPPDSGEKVTLGLTVLLAFSVFMLLVAENMPPTSEYIPLIGT